MKKIILYFQLIRFHRPIGTLLLLWPGLWALWLANGGIPSLKLLGIFLLGTFLTRSAGCLINDIWDRKFDIHVERTKTRPLATGQVSLRGALLFLGTLAILCLLLAFQLNFFGFLLCIVAGVIAAFYPLVKRISYFPQFVMGVAFAMPVLIAYAASLNSIPFNGWLLFFLTIIWALAYDTAYALTDLSDDLKIGVKSTAVFFQERSPIFIRLLQIIFCSGFFILGIMAHLKMVFFLMLLLSCFFFIYQNVLLRHNKPFQAFLNNQWVGFLLWLGIVFS